MKIKFLTEGNNSYDKRFSSQATQLASQSTMRSYNKRTGRAFDGFHTHDRHPAKYILVRNAITTRLHLFTTVLLFGGLKTTLHLNGTTLKYAVYNAWL